MSMNKHFRHAPCKWDPKQTSTMGKIENPPVKEVLHLLKNSRQQLTVLGELNGDGASISFLALTARTTDDLAGTRTPFWVMGDGHRDVNLVVDLRSATTIDLTSRELKVTNQKMRSFEINRMVAMGLFLSRPEALETFSALPVRSFARVLRSVISRTSQLDYSDAAKVEALAVNYWLTMFETDPGNEQLDSREREVRVARIARYASTTPELYRMYDNGDYIPTMEVLVERVKSCISSPKIKHLTKELLFSLVSTLNSKDPTFGFNMMVGLEHPPTFIALVLQAAQNLNESAFSNEVKQITMSYRDTRDATREWATLLDRSVTLED